MPYTTPAELDIGLVTGSVAIKTAPNINPPVRIWKVGYHNPSPLIIPIIKLITKTVNKYDIEIEKVYINNNQNNKSMLIKITDKELLEKTGGIIQGMSGAPIIQEGKFVGAVTNVLVNDPTQGYGVFADIMIKEMRSI